MKRFRRQPALTLVTVVALALGAAACKKPAPPAVSVQPAPAPSAPATAAPAPAPAITAHIEMGTAIDAGNKIATPAASFKPADTIYASVMTHGEAGGKALSARWTYGAGGQLVSESVQNVAPGAMAVTEFHVSKADGFPAGEYKVEASLDGKVVASQSFSVAG
jgi:hypothetical protein